jgi:hypothetical protein
MKTFRNLKAWEKSHNLVLSVYKVTMIFPRKSGHQDKLVVGYAPA